MPENRYPHTDFNVLHQQLIKEEKLQQRKHRRLAQEKQELDNDFEGVAGVSGRDHLDNMEACGKLLKRLKHFHWDRD